MSDPTKCDGCGTTGYRRIGKAAPDRWWSAELRDHTTGEAFIIVACSASCRETAVPWAQGAALTPDPPKRGTLLRNVSPCDGGGKRACGGTERVVIGFGVRAAGFVDVACLGCDARSVMMPAVAAICAKEGP